MTIHKRQLLRHRESSLDRPAVHLRQASVGCLFGRLIDVKLLPSPLHVLVPSRDRANHIDAVAQGALISCIRTASNPCASLPVQAAAIKGMRPDDVCIPVLPVCRVSKRGLDVLVKEEQATSVEHPPIHLDSLRWTWNAAEHMDADNRVDRVSAYAS